MFPLVSSGEEEGLHVAPAARRSPPGSSDGSDFPPQACEGLEISWREVAGLSLEESLPLATRIRRGSVFKL